MIAMQVRKMARTGAAGILAFIMLACAFAFVSQPAELGGDSAASELVTDQALAEINYTKPSNYTILVGWYQQLETKYPGYLEVFKANQLYGTGTITGGYDAWYVRLTNESRGLLKPESLFVGGPHGDETVGTISDYWFCNWTLRSAFEPPYYNNMTEHVRWMLDNREVYFAVSQNPYGFDHVQRYDANGWDLNREADVDGPDPTTGPPAVFTTVNGKTLREFVDHHQIRTGADFHGGARLLLYPWGSTHSTATGVSKVSGKSYTYAPPDFNYFDTSSLRAGAYIGSYGGALNFTNIGTIPTTVGYTAMGGIGPWAYGGDADKNPKEAAYVDQPPYPGAGVLWLSPEMSVTKNPLANTFGGDNVAGYGPEIRRFILHAVDLAQPYVRMQPGSVANNSAFNPGATISLKWQVNGSMVVDHTYVQWGGGSDPANNYSYSTSDFNANAGKYVGGTGWEGAVNGFVQSGVTYTQPITLPTTPGDYYFVAKAKVDQVYNGTLASADYDANHSYLRSLKERMQPGYAEDLSGTDGTEHMQYSEWWYGPVIKLTVNGTSPPWTNITVQPGWNLVSVPFVASDTSLPSALQDKADGGAGLVQWDRVQSYSPFTTANLWRQYNTGWSASLNDLASVNHSMGVWLFVTSVGDGKLCLGGAGYSNSTNATIPLKAGWNLVGYPARDDSAYTVGNLISSTVASLVEGFNASATYRTSALASATVLKRGQAYWVYCPSETTWTVDW